MTEKAPNPRGWFHKAILEPNTGDEIRSERRVYPNPHGKLVAILDHGMSRTTQGGIAIALNQESEGQIRFALVTTPGEEENNFRTAEVVTSALTLGKQVPESSASYATCTIGPKGVQIEIQGNPDEILAFEWGDWIILMSSDTARVLGETKGDQVAALKSIITEEQQKNPDVGASGIADAIQKLARLEIEASQTVPPDPDAVPPENIILVVFKKGEQSDDDSDEFSFNLNLP